MSAHDAHGHLIQARDLGRPPSSLAGDDLVLLAMRPHDDRLKDTHLAHGIGQGRDALIVDDGTRLIGVWGDDGDGQLRRLFRALLVAGRDERAQPAAKPPLRH
jgi:hypothetical protein